MTPLALALLLLFPFLCRSNEKMLQTRAEAIATVLRSVGEMFRRDE